MKEHKALVVAAGVGVLGCALLAAPYLPGILAATILAVVFQPLHRRMERMVRHRSLAAFLTVFSVLLVVLVPVILLTSAAVGEVRTLMQRVPASDAIERRLDPVIEWIAGHAGFSTEELRTAILDRLAQASGAVLRSTTALAGALTEGVVQLAVGVMTLFFILRDGGWMMRRLVESAPIHRDKAEALLRNAGESIVANVYGVLAVAVAQGLLAGAGFFFAGLPSPLLWALAAAFFSMVPLIGTGIVWVPAVLLLGAEGHWGRAALLAAWSGGVVAMADNVVRPWVVGKQMNASPMLVFFALLGGVRIFGLPGLFIGPLILSLTSALLALVWQSPPPVGEQAE
ncbi:MAG: AI-2E family transporter [Acidobacteria bacterium]|nr:AI-2E family transporter [Acidobacteriota bacterium]